MGFPRARSLDRDPELVISERSSMYKVEGSHGRHLPSACGLHMHRGSHECVHMRAKILIKN